MARMRALRTFTDASTGHLVMQGREFECAPAAASRLADSRMAEPVEAPKPKPVRRQPRKKRG